MCTPTVAGLLSFSNLCGLLDAISNPKTERKQKLAYLKQFMCDWRENHNKLHQNDTNTNDSFFPAMRIILPSFDKERGSYGFKETNLARKLVNIFLLGKTTSDAKRLLNFKGASKDSDFAFIASDILKFRLSSDKTGLTIEELNKHLDSIALHNANREQSAVDKELELVCRRVTPSELKWLIRILLKQMNLRMGEATVLNLFHPQASQFYDVSTCLKTVCKKCHDPTKTMDEIEIELFHPFRPMLAARVNPERCIEMMGRLQFYVEIKYDGERVQIHKDGDKYMYYSRNGNDLTESYGGTPCSGSITPRLHDLFHNSIDNCILDAEMVGWNTLAKCIATKGENFDVKSLKPGDVLEPCLVVFDCLLWNSNVITGRTLEDRLKCLHRVFNKEKEGTLMYAKHDLGNNVAQLIISLNNAVEQREEGIVVKSPRSTYRLNTRDEKAGWIKIKPDYVDQMCDDLDLVIVGGYMGDGIRANLLSHFLLAVAVTDQTGSVPSQFVSVCKVGSGYSMKELYDLNVYLTRNQMIKAGPTAPDWLKIGSEKPQVYIKPENSKVLQIRCAEITQSSSYGTGFTLRFPRVEKIRNDKSYVDCMTLEQFDKMRLENAGKIALKHKTEICSGTKEEVPASKKTRTAGGTKSGRPVLGGQFKGADLRNVKAKSKIFSGKQICVINGVEGFGKSELEMGAAGLGATLAQNPGPSTWCVVAGRKILKVQNLIKVGDFDVVNAEWLRGCIQEHKYIQWKPSDMIFATEKTEKSFLSRFDKFGDSFTEEIDCQELKQLMCNIKEKKISENEILDVEFEIFPDYEFGIFKTCKFYFDLHYEFGNTSSKIMADSPLSFTKAQALFYGANLATNLSQATHIIIDESDLSRLTFAVKYNEEREIKLHIVNLNWVRDCVNSGRLLNERPYGCSYIT